MNAWTPIIGGDTGREVSDKLDIAFADIYQEITDLDNGKQPKKLEVFTSYNDTNQEPSGTDDPMMISFGGAANTPEVFLGGNGEMEIKKDGEYRFATRFQVGKGNKLDPLDPDDIAICYIRVMVNGQQEWTSSLHRLIDYGVNYPCCSEVALYLYDGDKVWYEFVRDSSGEDMGGLYSFQPSLAGSNVSPSASIEVNKVG